MLVYKQDKEDLELNEDYIELITPLINDEALVNINSHYEYAYIYDYHENELDESSDDLEYEINVDEFFVP